MTRPLVALAALALLVARPASAIGMGKDRGSDGFRAEYLFNFATSTGSVRMPLTGLIYDPTGDELYILGQGAIRIFNPSGMETFVFGDEPELGAAIAVTALESGDVLALLSMGDKWSVLRASFRGEAKEEVKLTGIPADFPLKEFHPVAIRHVGGKLYLADKSAMRVLVTGVDGVYSASYDLAALIEAADKRGDLGIRGFSVDREGNILFTVSPMFKAFVLSPGGELRSFGRMGSASGRFGVVGGITRDERGNFYVSDVLRCVVLVFDKSFTFLGEFGGRGFGWGNLIGPVEVAVAKDKVYVTQGANRGVSVFVVAPGDEPPPAPAAPTDPATPTAPTRPAAISTATTPG